MVHSARILLFVFCCENSVFEVEVMTQCIHILLSSSGILFLETLCVEQPLDEPLAVQNVPECTDWSKVNNVQHFQSDQLGGPHKLLFSGYQGSFLGWSGWSVKLTTELHLMQSWERLEIFFYSPIHLHGADRKFFMVPKFLYPAAQTQSDWDLNPSPESRACDTNTGICSHNFRHKFAMCIGRVEQVYQFIMFKCNNYVWLCWLCCWVHLKGNQI
jgi:hypothetical protein